MAFKVPKIPVCVAIACCGVALIFQLVAVVGTGWQVGEIQYPNGIVHEEDGLFRGCINDVCMEVQSTWLPNWWKACQAFSILGLLTIAGGLLAGIQHAVSENTAKASLAGIATCLSSTVFLTIEVAVFGAKSSESSAYQFDYGFYLSIAACVLSFISAVLFAVGLRL
ncbi:uncharacterized protein LOC112563276 [Pomacea canaliculata]|uniref:uncharacterized protein LOC112563276 n=1 Tax=Pomacea canaliculata TaxID=400727 RepID=UPI000D73B9EF|nr:uncharacterized protein LOC112563276 [Pomacea canaliculata]